MGRRRHGRGRTEEEEVTEEGEEDVRGSRAGRHGEGR